MSILLSAAEGAPIILLEHAGTLMCCSPCWSSYSYPSGQAMRRPFSAVHQTTISLAPIKPFGQHAALRGRQSPLLECRTEPRTAWPLPVGDLAALRRHVPRLLECLSVGTMDKAAISTAVKPTTTFVQTSDRYAVVPNDPATQPSPVPVVPSMQNTKRARV